jgi:hypothetical protein
MRANLPVSLFSSYQATTPMNRSIIANIIMRLTRRFALPILGFDLPISGSTFRFRVFPQIPPNLLMIQMSFHFICEGEPPGEPLLVISGDDADESIDNRIHHNAAHQEVRPPNIRFDLPVSGFPSNPA